MSTAERLAAAKRYLAERGLSSSWDSVAARARRPGSVVLARHAARPSAVHRPAPPRARNFSGGGQGPYTRGWDTTDRPINAALAAGLKAMRARSNWLARNGEYAAAFLRLVRSNVVGPQGFALQLQIKKPRGGIDTAAGQVIEDAFARWGRIGVCDYTGEYSWLDLCNLWINTVARDGEVLVRRFPGAGPFGYQIQLLDPALLDESFHANLGNGHTVRMSIERDANRRRVAYWLAGSDRADPLLGGLAYSGKRVRVPAEEIWHDFRPMWVGQLRGLPWIHAGMVRQHRLEEFELAALAAAEEGAKKLAWITSPSGTLQALADGTAERRQADAASAGAPAEASVPAGHVAPEPGLLYTDSDDGIHYANLPPGYAVTPYSANFPDEAVGPFVRTSLQALSAAWGVPHHSLSGDMSGVTYSSARIAEIEARDLWKSIQQFQIERLCARVFSEWLPHAILSGELGNLAMDRLARYDAAYWQGRRWEWVDPDADTKAAERRLALKLTSRRREQMALGIDPEDTANEREMDDELDARFAPDEPAAPGANSPAADPAPEPDDPGQADD